MTDPACFADLDLARRLERAEAHSSAKFVEARARVSPHCGARWIEVAGAYAMYDGIASPVTQTLGLGLFQPATGAGLEAIERFFAERGSPVFYEVSPLAGLGLVDVLNERGYQPVEFTSVMYRPLPGEVDPAEPRNEKIRARPVRAEEQEVWARTAAQGWREFGPAADFLLDVGPAKRAKGGRGLVYHRAGRARDRRRRPLPPRRRRSAGGGGNDPGGPKTRRAARLTGRPPALRRRTGLRHRHDLRAASRGRLAAQRRAARLSPRVHADQVGSAQTARMRQTRGRLTARPGS
jgi:hypothetical protein